MKLKVLTPSINESVYRFAKVSEQEIRYGLGALKGLGQGAIESILEERESKGDFRDLADFCVRVDLQKVNKRALETLIRSGAMDPLDDKENRARLLNSLETVLQSAEQIQRDREAGQSDMFGNANDSSTPIQVEIPDLPPWPELQRLQAEKAALGLFLTGHPALVHHPDTKRFTSTVIGRLSKLVPESDGKRRGGMLMTLCGLVCAVRRANRRLFVTIEDHTGRMDVALYDEAYALYSELLTKDEMVVFEGKVSADDFNGGYRMTANKVMSLGEAKTKFARGVSIMVKGPQPLLPEELKSAFAPYRNGVGSVYVNYRNQRARARFELGDDWSVNPCEELVAALNNLESVHKARLIF